jgi:hypothetical protein
MEVNIVMDDWREMGPILLAPTGLRLPDLTAVKKRAGVYLIETRHGRRVERWYVGESGNLAKRLNDYRLAAHDAGTARGPTESRVARTLLDALNDGREARVRVLLKAGIRIPARLFDEDGNPLTWDASLDDTTLRVLVESAVVVHQTESMSGSWEIRLNRGGRRKSTKPTDSPLEDIFEGIRRARP